MADELLFKSIRELATMIREGQVSPVAVTEFFLARLDELGPAYNSLVTLTGERALETARRAESEIVSGEEHGLLSGIPWGAKDLLATSGGIPTTWGAEPFRDQQFEHDATVVTRLEADGAPLAGKLAMIELAGGMGYHQPNASLTGPPRNPWDRDRWTGGSSSGSGAAVAAGLVPFAIGSETWGSILSPSNNCGLSGLRPTYGRVSRSGAMALCWTLDKLGPLCLTADDCGIVLEAIAGPDPNDPTTYSQEFSYDAALDTSRLGRKFKLGVPRDVAEGAQDAVKRNFEAALDVLSDVADIEEVSLPDLPYVEIVRTILMVEAASAFEDFLGEGGPQKLTAPEDHYGPYARTAILATDYVRALRLRGLMARQVDGVMSEYDAFAAPTSLTTATPIVEQFRRDTSGPGDIVGAIGNGCGLPSLSAPSGFDADGMPTGIQFMARAYDENICIAIGRAFQERTSWHTRHPADMSVGR
jgi:aspartyl-tRNA(Asn)/glutamyl-tRNA(Gln) amidotransferase subunit A